MKQVYIGLGSNLQQPEQQIKQARTVIAGHESIIAIAFSSLYTSPPMGPQDQPDYVNAVMEIKTSLAAIDLLRVLQMIENQHGRVRKKEQWGARTLDLDLLIFADQEIQHPDLIVPHVGLAERAFVLYPLQEIAPPDMLIPGLGSLKHLVSRCAINGLEKLA